MAKNSSDISLVESVCRGDTKAVVAFKQRLSAVVGPCLWSVRQRWGSAPPAQDDVEQAVALQLLERDCRVLRTFAGKSSLQTWLRTIVLRSLHRQVAQLVKQKRQENPNNLNEVVEEGPNPEETAIQQERRLQVRQAIGELAAEDQLLIKLIYEQGAKAEVVGRVLGISTEAVRMRKSRLLKRLGEIFAKSDLSYKNSVTSR